MWRRNSYAPIGDEEVTKLARRYRIESIATLIAVCRDERAPASARASAASKLLEYSDGKPGQAKQVTVADVAAMSDEQRQQLLNALLTHFVPSGFQSLLEQACNEAVKQYEESLAPHAKPNRFQRDAAAFPPPEPSSENTRYAALSRDSGLRAIPDGHEHSGNRESPARAATLAARDTSSDSLRSTLTHEREERATADHEHASKPPQADGAARANSAKRPAQPEIVNGRIPVNPLLGPLLGDVLATGHGPITQEILRRSRLRNPLADFYGYDPSVWRK